MMGLNVGRYHKTRQVTATDNSNGDSAGYCQLSVTILNSCAISQYEIRKRANRFAKL